MKHLILKRLVTALIAVIFLAGCAEIPLKPDPGKTKSAFWADQKTRNRVLEHVVSKMAVHFEGKSEKVTGQGQLAQEIPDFARMELRDPLGRLQLLATLSGKDFLATYPTRHLTFRDKSSGKDYLKKVLGGGLSFQKLGWLAWGILPNDATETAMSWEWDGKIGRYVGRTSAYRMEIDPEFLMLRKLVLDGEGVQIDYSDFRPCCKGRPETISVPYLIAVRHEKSASSIEMDVTDIKPSGQLDRKIFSQVIPNGFRTVDLGEP